VELDLRIAALLAESLGRPLEALDVMKGVLDRTAINPEIVRIGRIALESDESRAAAAELLSRIAAASEGESAEELLYVLLQETAGDAALSATRAAWSLRLVELSGKEPARALGVAVAAAEAMPDESSLWDAAEKYARRAGDPRTVADAYARTLTRTLQPSLAESLGRRFVELHEEWFDEPEEVLRRLERVLVLSPRARWALDRIKLAYNADGRWEDLFGLYDRAITLAEDDAEREDLLDEAAVAAKDLANDADRAIHYLERRNALRSDPRIEAMLERLYERTARAQQLLALLEKRAAQATGAELVRLDTRLARLQLELKAPDAAFDLLCKVLASNPEAKDLYPLFEQLVASGAPVGARESDRGKPPGKGAKKVKPKTDVRHEAVRILEERYRRTRDSEGLARVLEAAREIAENDGERVARLEELVALYDGDVPDPEKAFVRLSLLLAGNPGNPAYRRRLESVAHKLGGEHRRAELLESVADGADDVRTKIDVLREAASVWEFTEELGRAVALYHRVLDVDGIEVRVALDVAARLTALLAALGRPGERCDVLDRIVAWETGGPGRRDALRTLSQVAFDELGDAARAARAYRLALEDTPEDVEALSGLALVLESAREFGELVTVLERRARLSLPDAALSDRIRMARLYETELRDDASSTSTWQDVRRTFGSSEESFVALSTLLSRQSRFDELAQLLEETADGETGERAVQLQRELGDVCRDRTHEWVRAIDAYARAGDFARASTVIERAADEPSLPVVASRLLEVSVSAWKRAEVDGGAEAAEAAHAAARALMLRHGKERAFEQVVAVGLHAAELPFTPSRRRRFVCDAAWVICDELKDSERAVQLLSGLFADDPGDAVAQESAARFVRLLESLGRMADVALFWEGQARWRAELLDRTGAAALFARAGDVWEARESNADRAILSYRQGAALGGEACLVALARIHFDQKSYYEAAAVLEWLCAQSNREELAERALRLADAYLAVGDWQHARARLERAALVASYPAKVRERLAELYRRHENWEALSRLLVSEAEQKTDDRARVALFVQAARLCSVERGDPAAAIPLLERAVELDPDDASLHLALSDAMQAAGRFDEARDVLRAQIDRYGHRRPKERALVHFHLAKVSLGAGHRAEALAELDIGAKINPAHPGILQELARLSLEEGQLARAERSLRALLLVQRRADSHPDEGPGRAEIYLDLSEIAAKMDEGERAAELVESAFGAALDSNFESESLEHALRKSGRVELLSRAIEARLSTAKDATSAARALSDLVVLHASQPASTVDVQPRVETEALRIHRTLESSGVADPSAWAALTSVYEWLGDTAARGKALERRVEALLQTSEPGDVEPLLNLAELRLLDPLQRDEGVSLAEAALDRGADVDRTFRLLHAASATGPAHTGLLRLLERLARGPGRERTLVEVVALSAQAGPVSRRLLQEAVELARSFGDRGAEIAILRGALSHDTAPDSGDFGVWPRERLARLLLEEGGPGATAEAADWLERASAYADPAKARRFVLEVASLAANELADLERAARLYRDVLERDPADREAWEPLLDVYRKSGERERLIGLIESTAPFAPSGADRCRLRLEEATLMLTAPGREAQAIVVLQEIVAENPQMAEAAALLESVLERMGRQEELAAHLAAQLDAARSRGDAATAEALSLKLAELFERAGDADRALEAYGTVLDSNPQSRAALRAVARLEELVGATAADVADAIERLLAVEEPALVKDLARRLVELRSEQGDSLGVERALEVGYAANPGDTALREQLVARCLERGDWGRAAQVLKRAAEADPSDTALVQRTVEAFEHAGELEHGVETLGLALASEAPDPDLYIERARLYGALGKHDLALEDIEKAHRIGGARGADLVAALEAAIERTEGEARSRHTLQLVDLLEGSGDTTPAREHLQKLIKREPRHREALRRLASLAAGEARWDEAAATYRRLIALESGPDLVSTAMNLADTCEHSGHLADARGGLERALEAVPDSVELRARLKQLYASTGANRELARFLLVEARTETEVVARTTALTRAAELLLEYDDDPRVAIEALEEVHRLTPESIQGAVLLARAHAMLGDARGATAALHEVVLAHRGKRTRELALVHREISNIHLEAGDLKGALDALIKAFDLDMRNGELAMQLGHLALDLKDIETAARAFRSVTMMVKVRLPGTNEGTSPESKAVAYYHLSRIAQAQGDVRKARLMVSKAVSENPAHAEAQTLLRELKSS
jgi:tetratricopeptide (TPR) repeat protein